MNNRDTYSKSLDDEIAYHVQRLVGGGGIRQRRAQQRLDAKLAADALPGAITTDDELQQRLALMRALANTRTKPAGFTLPRTRR